MKLKPASEAELRVGAILAGARRFVDVSIEGTPLRARMRLLTRKEEREVAFKLAEFLAAGPGDDRLAATMRMPLSSETAHRVLALALRRTDADEPIFTYEDLDEADDRQIGALWSRYQDLVAEMNPEEVELDAATHAAICDALKKKDPIRLRAFGASALSIFMLTTADPPAS